MNALPTKLTGHFEGLGLKGCLLIDSGAYSLKGVLIH